MSPTPGTPRAPVAIAPPILASACLRGLRSWAACTPGVRSRGRPPARGGCGGREAGVNRLNMASNATLLMCDHIRRAPSAPSVDATRPLSYGISQSSHGSCMPRVLCESGGRTSRRMGREKRHDPWPDPFCEPPRANGISFVGVPTSICVMLAQFDRNTIKTRHVAACSGRICRSLAGVGRRSCTIR